MSYEPTNWKSGDKVTSTRLNKIEQGIKGIDNDTSRIKEDLNSIRSNPINLFEMKGFTPNSNKTNVTVNGNSVTVATNQATQYGAGNK